MPNETENAKIVTILQRATQMVGLRQYAPAERVLRPFLKAYPDHPLANHLLGIALVEQGQIDPGFERLHHSLQLQPDDAMMHSSLAAVYQDHGRTDEAQAAYRKAIEIDPNLGEAYANLGKLLLGRKEYAEAQGILQKAVALMGSGPETINDLGVALLKQNKLAEAEGVLRRAIQLNEGYATAHNNLGSVLHKSKKLESAEWEFRRAITLDPKYAQAYENLARVLHDRKKDDEALPIIRAALMLAPNSPEGHRVLGSVLHRSRQGEAAVSEMLRALELRPDDVRIVLDLIRIYQELDRLDEAEALLQRARELDGETVYVLGAIGFQRFLQGRVEESRAAHEESFQRDPSNTGARLARAARMLEMGDFATGWAEHEWRLTSDDNDVAQRKFFKPRWDGKALEGQAILLYGEQGIGDAIQFCRYAPMVAQMGGRVIMECRASLVRLMKSLESVDSVIAAEEMLPPPYDVHCPLMSLPFAFGTTLETIPSRMPYLHADPQDVQTWKDRLSKHERLRVGLAWSGNFRHLLNHRRSIPLQALTPLLATPDVEFYSLQMDRASEIAAVAAGKITDLTASIRDFADTAAAMTQMDLIISVDTAVAHLAGALNIPVWLMLYFPGEWRWLQDRGDSPWYPSMRIFRQRDMKDWAETTEEVASALRQHVATFAGE